MIIYPDIELQDGKCVNLRRGVIEDPIVYDVAPLEAAKKFADAGAEWLNITDLDGVLQGGRHNADIIADIVKAVDIPVQVGGGVRTMNTIDWWIEHGAERVVMGTAAVKDRTLVRNACAHYPGKIVVSVDAKDGMVVIEGWKVTTSFAALEVAKDLEQTGVAALIYTDIDRDIDEPENSFAQTTELAGSVSIPVISSGTVKTLDDISTLRYLPNIAGAIVGRALFGGAVDLQDAIEIAAAPYEVPAFA